MGLNWFGSAVNPNASDRKKSGNTGEDHNSIKKIRTQTYSQNEKPEHWICAVL